MRESLSDLRNSDGAFHRANLYVRFKGRVFITGEVRITSHGLLAIGGLVSSILLSTAVLVGVSTRHLPKRDRGTLTPARRRRLRRNGAR